MNFLAHLYLSRSSIELMVGNFIADSVKGKKFEAYPPIIAKGIKMHRAIDSFTDSHEVVLESKKRLRPAYGKYSAVLIDIFFDHILAKNWHDYHKERLPSYSQQVYLSLKEYHSLFPEKSQRFYHYMVSYDILSNYATIDGIQQALNGMSRRARFDSNMEKATKELQLFEKEFEDEFRAFFPDLEKHVLPFLK